MKLSKSIKETLENVICKNRRMAAQLVAGQYNNLHSHLGISNPDLAFQNILGFRLTLKVLYCTVSEVSIIRNKLSIRNDSRPI